MAETMYDTTSPSAIPSDATMVAGYIDGLYAWKDTDWARFPQAVHVQITVDPTSNHGDVYDCEPGNRSTNPAIWPAQCKTWVSRRIAAGIHPVIYCDKSDWPTIQKACAGLDVQYWIADPHTNPHTIPGAIAVQYAWSKDPAAEGRNVDVSTVYGGPWLRATKPTVPAFPGTIAYGLGLLPHAPSQAVKLFQSRLNFRGFGVGVVDGRDGHETTDALKRFQAHVDIVVDGVGGPVTWSHLWS